MDRRRTGRRNPQIVQAARGMRLEPTPAERVLWKAVRDGRLCGVPIRRQHPVDRFVLDFYCASHKLAIELDGEIHEAQQDQDAERTLMLTTRGIRVIRFRSEEVLSAVQESALDTGRSGKCGSPVIAAAPQRSDDALRGCQKAV